MPHLQYTDSILDARGSYRDEKGKRVFKVLWHNGDVTKEPLNNLINNATYNEYIETVLKEYQRVASMYPTRRRFCLMCEHKTVPGTLFCKRRKCCVMKERVDEILFCE